MARLFATASSVMLIIGIYSHVSADPPSPPSPVENKIREALDGTSGVRETGDPVLDDILNVIKGRGSVLDGSLLQDPSAADSDPSVPRNAIAAKAAVAEQLLKASRLLEKLGSLDAMRKTLITQMRAEAVKLLSE